MAKENSIIILGTAHLSSTPGKCSPDKSLIEARYSREIVEDIKSILLGYGYEVLVDYPALDPLPEIKSSSYKTEQLRELSWRVKFVNDIVKKNPKKNVIYVSVHVNGAGSGASWMGARGWSAYTTPGKTKSDQLACDLYWAANKYLNQEYKSTFDSSDGKQRPIRTDMTDGDPDMESNLYVLAKTLCPAVLTENLFQDNKKDVEFLLSDVGRHQIARIHVEGIIKYIQRC